MGWLETLSQPFAAARPRASETAAGDGVRVGVDELIRLRHSAAAIGLDSRRQAVSALAGGYHSRFRGRGMDYQESRNYQPGDDIRNMDWRVLARSGRPHTKLYREEREKPVIVMLDLNPSMFFGTRTVFKSVLAARAAALLGWAAVRNGDRIGAFLFGGGRHHEISPAGGRRGALRLIRELAAWSEPPDDSAITTQGGLGEALRRLRRVARPGSFVFILSDFYSLDADADPQLAHLRRHNDVVACRILDPLELAPPPPGRYGISDGRRTGFLDTGPAKLRQAYQAHFAQHDASVRELLRRRAVPLIRLLTGDDLVEGLKYGLVKPA